MADDKQDTVLTWVSTARTAAAECDRPDLAARLGAAVARLQRPSTIICVVGEFKQGKSSLVNAILGGEACPVDDDLATAAVTVVHAAPSPQVNVRLRAADGKGTVVEKITPAQIADYVTERGNPDNERGVERVDIGLAHPLLQGGVTLVDTPGMGGIGSGVAAMTLAFVPFADALLFVSDASAELSAPEVALLRQVRDLCPVVRLVLTKVDLYPEWPRIRDLDRSHLAAAGLADVEIIPVSSAMRLAGAKRKSETLVTESGIPELVDVLRDDAQGRVKGALARAAVAEADAVLGQLVGTYATELASLEDRSVAEASLRDLQAANDRVEQLRAAGSRWTTVLNDRMGDVSSRIGHGFRGAMRDVNRRCDERIENLESSEHWEELARDLQSWVAAAVTDLLSMIDEGVETTRQEIAALLAQDGADLLPGAARGLAIDVAELWREKTAPTASVGQRVMGGLSVVRGAQGGIMMLGMMGRFLPGAAATILLSNPVTIGLGVLFAGHAVMEQRKKKVAAQRLQAKQNVRLFIDDVQFEVGNELTELVRQAQRDVRDEFSALLAELQRTVSEAVARAKQNAQASEGARTARIGELRKRIDVLERIRTQERPS